MKIQACPLIKDKNSAIGYTQESWDHMTSEWLDILGNILDNTDDGNDVRKFKRLFKEALHNYRISGIQDKKAVAKFIEDYINDPLNGVDWIIEYVPAEGIFNSLNKPQEIASSDSAEQYDEDGEKLQDSTDVSSRFMDLTFGSNVTLKNAVKQRAMLDLISAFVINRETNEIVPNITSANKNSREHKQKLFDTICEYLGIESSPLFNGDEYTGVLNSPEYLDGLKRAGSFEVWDVNKIEQAYRNEDKTQFNAFTAWYILNNYDNFVNLILGDAVAIHPSYIGKLSGKDIYNFTDKHGANITTWKTDDNNVMSEVISKLAQSLIITTPLYKMGVDNPTGEFLKFEDFYRIITKIKDLATKQNPKLDEGINGPGTQSLRSLINGIRKHAITAIPDVFEQLLSNNYKDILNQYFPGEDSDKLYSLYKGIFSKETPCDATGKPLPGWSLKSIQHKTVDKIVKGNLIKAKVYSHNQQNYYDLITQVADSMFSVGFMQYYENNDVITVRALNELGVDNSQRNVEQIINALNSKRIISEEFDKYQMKPYNATILRKESQVANSPITGISIKIGEYEITLSGKSALRIKKNGEIIIPKTWIEDQNVINFIEQQLGLLLDDQMKTALTWQFDGSMIGTEPRNTQIELLKLSLNVLLNKYVSNVILANETSPKEIRTKVASIFEPGYDAIPKYNYTLNELNLIADNYLPTLRKIASAKNILTGEAFATQVKTADGDTLSQQCLSRLIANITSQWEEIKQNHGACENFSLLKPGVYLGHYTSKEIKSQLGNKSETKFSVGELAQGAFLYDFIAGLSTTIDKTGRNLYGNGKVGFYPSVNSDKGTIGRIIIDLGTMCDRLGKAYKDLTIDELYQLTRNEMAEAYRKSKDMIKSDYDELQNWLLNTKGISVNFDLEHDFQLFNDYAKSQGIKPDKLLFNWTREYNNQHPANPIRLIENVHYEKGTDGIKFNGTYKALQSRFEDPFKFQSFINKKHSELVVALLGDNTEFNLFNEGETDNLTPKKYLRTEFKEWVNFKKYDGKTTTESKNGRMAIARLTLNGTMYQITSKQDLIQFAQDADITVEKILNDPHVLLNYGLTLHPMLEKYNALDYLFTQEFMMSGVGSHVAHPGKTKLKPVCVYEAEGITLGAEDYNELVWEEYFQPKADEYLAKNPNIKPEDFAKFKKDCWDKAKKIAVSRGVVLYCKDVDILNSQTKDFTTIVTTKDSSLNTNPVLKSKIIVINTDADIDVVFDKLEDKLEDNIIQEEAARFLAQHKRNVSYTAQMQEFLLGKLDGIPTEYNMAMMEDVPAFTYTITGDTNVNDSYDGATFVNPLVVYWENNSLAGAKAGVDKKPFVHFYDEKTGTGGIIKTAGFGVTNDRMRKFKFYRDMCYNMMARPWVNEDGTLHEVEGNGILEDFEGNEIFYNEIYFKKGNKYYYREIVKYDKDYEYEVEDWECDPSGKIISDKEPKRIRVTNNYEMWQMFGGMRSMELVGDKLQYSEISLKQVAKAASNYGKIKKGHTTALTQEDVYQPMKHSDIHYMPTKGAVKQGACNINPYSYFNHKVEGGLNFMKVKMLQAGIQLDKEHHANNSVLSLMTQVISSACSRGLMPTQSQNLYNALYELTKVGTKNFRDELGNLIVVDDPEKFNNGVAEVILKAVINSSPTDGDMMQAIAREIVNKMEAEKIFQFTPEALKEFDTLIPYSSPEIFRKIVSTLTSALTKKGIKAKTPGVLSVLCPAHEIVKFYKVPILNEAGDTIGYKRVTLDELEDQYGIDTEEELRTLLDNLQAKEPTFTDVHDVEIGYKYLITHLDGSREIVHIVRPDAIEKDQGLISYNVSIDEAGNIIRDKEERKIPFRAIGYVNLKNMTDIKNIQEWTRDGQDLHSYQLKFNSTDGNKYQLGDLDIVQDYFKLKNSKEDKLDFLLNLVYNKYGKGFEFYSRIKSEFENLDVSQENQQQIDLMKLIIEQFNPEVFDLTEYKSNIKQLRTEWAKDEDSMQLGLQVAKMLGTYLEKKGIGFMNRTMQQTLNAISTASSDIQAMVDGKTITVDKSSIKTQAFGILMPKTLKEKFGLDQFDSLEDIKNDPMFFTKKIVRKFSTKVDSYPLNYEGLFANNFDIELKRNDGNHIYIRLDTNPQGVNGRGADEGCDLTNEVEWFKQIDPDGKVYRTNAKKEIMYEMFSANDKIYKDIDGNEIIVPGKNDDNDDRNPIEFYLNNMHYATVNISELTSDSIYSRIMESIKLSTNKRAQSFYSKVTTNSNNITEQRKRIKKYNNYDRAVLDEDPGSLQLQHIQDLGNEMRTSFLRTLDLIAARIPSQNQQSFMAMEVEGFDNPDINTAYVSIFQFYLQGSDLDIDAVSLQTFDVDESGLFVGHSPYYSLESPELRKASEDLPFPTGRKVELQESKNTNLREMSTNSQFVNLMSEFANSLLVINISAISDEAFIRLNTSTPENIKQLAKLIEKVNQFGLDSIPENFCAGVAAFLNEQYFEGKDFIKNYHIPQLIDKIKKIVDDHNMYIHSLGQDQKERLIKNYAVTQLYNIIINPINLLESWSSVDTVTAPVKDLASTSPNAVIQYLFSPGNVINKFQSLVENMVGKDGIAICATGLKSFFAFTLLYQQMLNDPRISAEQKDALLSSEVSIGGKKYKGLANAFSPLFLSMYEHQISENQEAFSSAMQDFLLEQLWASDAANDMSALLGLSTDNAKELVLAKINAGTATLGMYLYGMALGVPVDTLYKIINSKLGRRLVELTKGDYFNGEVGTRNIIGALSYFKYGPNLDKYTVDLGEMRFDSPKKLIEKQIASFGKNKDMKLGDFFTTFKYKAVDMLESVRSKVESLVPTTLTNRDLYIIQTNRAIDALIQYAQDRKLLEGENNKLHTIYGTTDIMDNLETLATGADEMKTCGKILHINQEIYTNLEQLADQIDTIECLTINRKKQIDKQEKRKGKQPEFEVIPRMRLEEFLTNEEYAQECIKEYDKYKQSFNVLRVIHDDPHYKGYIESLLIAYKGLCNKTAKAEVSIQKARDFIEKQNVVDPKLKEQVSRNAETACDLFIRSAFLLSKNLTFKVEASTKTKSNYIFIDNLNNPKPNLVDRTIQLGTPLGDANFKLLMERTIIPDLKKKYSNNKFLRDLTFIIGGTSDVGTKILNYGLKIDMMPNSKDENAVDLFNQYKDSFNQLQTLEPYKGHTIQELFYLYSLIAYKGKQGPTSLHGILQDYTGSIVKDYRQFIGEVDNNPELRQVMADFITDEMLAPKTSPYKRGSRLIKYFDRTKNIPVLLEMQETEDDMDFDLGYDEEERNSRPDYPNKYVLKKALKDINFDFFGVQEIPLDEFKEGEEISLKDIIGYDIAIKYKTDSKGNLVEFVLGTVNVDPNLNSKIKDNLKYIPYIVKDKKFYPDTEYIQALVENIKKGCI